jgi:hypothetical protein
MEFGRARPPRARGGAGYPAFLASRSATLRVALGKAACLAACLALGALALSSCGAGLEKRRLSSLASSLASIDSLIGSRDRRKLEGAFAKAYREARNGPEWLSILKRAKACEAVGDAGRYAGAADRARKALPRSEPVAAAAAHAYLRSGRPSDALALFGGPVSPEARPELWAEAFLASAAGGARVSGADYGRLADIAGSPRAYLGAAAAALAAGSRPAAKAWIEKALDGGAQAPPELLWDCDQYEALAARPDQNALSGELAIMGDAAWMTGRLDLSKRRYLRSLSLAPRRSWKAYANLALMDGDSGEAAESYWSRMSSAFLSGPASSERDGALGALAAHLARGGREDEALRALSGGGGSAPLAILATTIRGRNWSEGRLAAEFERLAAERADDPEVHSAALRALALRGMFGEVALLRQGAARKGAQVAYGWYYDAAVRAARGDFQGAAAVIETSEGGRGPGLAGPYALGCLYAAMGDSARSAESYAAAAAAAGDGRERCAAFKALGRSLGEAGDRAGSAAAFGEAAAADPTDAEAALLARVASRNKAAQEEDSP